MPKQAATPTRRKPGAARESTRGAGVSLAEKFRRLGLVDPQDLVMHLPLRYEDETRVQPIASLRPGLPGQVEGEVLRSDVSYRPRRQLVATLRDDTGELSLRWLTFYPSQLQQMQAGRRWRVRGEVRGGYFGLEMIHPRITVADAPLPVSLTPIYPTTEGLAQVSLRRAIAGALMQCPLDDTLPATLVDRLSLMPFAQAIKILHSPSPADDADALMEHTHPAWLRVKFDELLAQQLSLAAAREARRAKKAPILAVRPGKASLCARLVKVLGFTLTEAQQRVISEISADLAHSYPMHRLLQGDVGSGKTVVAAMAAMQAIDAGMQVAVMAPTEILAEQHYQKMRVWCEALGIEVRWLTGSMPARARRGAVEAIASGQARLVIGTQALIQDSVRFCNLGLVVVDEQHRFGVAQRLDLTRKGEADAGGAGDPELVPHQLTMSATPIPRTLAMTFFADLEVSSIDGMPPGRKPVTTKLVSSERRAEIIAHVMRAAAAGTQTYWVCPLIEESEALDLQTAVDTHAALALAMPGLAVGLVHGRMPTAEKAGVMRAFRNGEISVLVATTVIEVGVDVPNAALMVVEHAERFGLAQLHQLRGRVGRGQAQSVCVLMFQAPLSMLARERLRAMYETQDGFEIAQRDLDLRGPGELLGSRQSGMALLKFADLAQDGALVRAAREAAIELRRDEPAIVIRHLARWMRGREDFLRS